MDIVVGGVECHASVREPEQATPFVKPGVILLISATILITCYS